MKRKKTIIGVVIGGVCCVALCSALVLTETDLVKADDVSVEEAYDEDKLFPDAPVPEEYEEDNLYVQMNNKLVSAINDYTEGKISEEEYKAICAEVNEVVSDEDNQEALKEGEEEYKKQVGGE